MGEWSLSENELAELLVLAQPFPLDSDAVEELARHWIGAAALAQRAGRGDEVTGADAVAASTWLERREALLALDREDRLGSTPVPDAEAAYREGRLRLLAHVLRAVGPETSAAEVDLQGRVARRILEALVDGGSWDDAVAESQDLDTRESSGLLGLFGSGELPPELDRAASGLEPGQVSSVIRSTEGFHILYRPRFGDVSDLFAIRLLDRRLVEVDVSSSRGVLAERGVSYSSRATASLRQIADDPWAALNSRAQLAKWDGGGLAEGQVARIVVSLPRRSRAEMARADERTLLDFIEEIALRELRVGDAEGRGLTLDEGLRIRLEEGHGREVAEWMTRLGIQQGSEPARGVLDRYMEGIVSRQVAGRSLSPLFEAWLLDGMQWTLDPTGVSGAIAQARAMLVGTTPP